MPFELEIIVIDRDCSKSYDPFMNEEDKKVIEELLTKQTENLNRAMDGRFKEQSDAFTEQIDARFQEQEERLGVRFQEQEERLGVRFQEQEERLEKRMIHVFNEGFEQIVLPHIAKIEEDIEDLQSRTGRIERTLNAVVDRQDRQGEEIKGIKKFIQMPEGA